MAYVACHTRLHAKPKSTPRLRNCRLHGSELFDQNPFSANDLSPYISRTIEPLDLNLGPWIPNPNRTV